MPEILTDAYLLFTFVFKQALKVSLDGEKELVDENVFENGDVVLFVEH